MSESQGWYPTDGATERLMYGNIDSKIDGYAAKYPFLNAFYLAAIHRMCETFIEGFDKMSENRATARQMTNWFENIVSSKQTSDPVPAPPVFQAFTMPAGATVGLEEQCRQFARLMKNQPNYNEADGLDLMIERQKPDGLNLSEAMPELKLTVSGETVKVEWRKTGFDALELQYRKQGAAMWQLADKSTVGAFDFTPPLSAAGVPEKFEFRAVYLIKNQRVGQWSPTFTVTVG